MNFSQLLLTLCFPFIFNIFYAQTPIGYDLLSKEKDAKIYLDNQAEKILDTLINDCIKDIQTENKFSPQEILKKIGNNIFKNGFKYHENNFSYSKALTVKQFDCDQFSITYLTITRKLNLPVYAVILPQHMIIVWEDNQSKIYWETTINFEKTEDEYKKDFKLNIENIKNSISIYKVQFNEEPAIIDNYIGTYLLHKKNYLQAKIFLENSLLLLPKLSSAKNNLGIIMQNIGNLDKAKQLFEEMYFC